MLKHCILRMGAALFFALLLWAVLAASCYASSEDAVWPEATGVNVLTNGKLAVDASNMTQGYVMVRVSKPSKHDFKMRVAYGKGQLTYDLNNKGDYETFPLQLGSGKYEISLFENVKGTKYSSEGKVALTVKLDDENAAYLVPNQYVDYDILTAAVAKSDELCGESTPEECYKIITDYMAGEYEYDFVRAKTISSGELPDIDYCYENHKGICQDLAAVMVCMLRVQGVPSKLVIGYADKYYHAWTSTVMDGQEVFFDPTAAIDAIKAKKYQVERMY